MVVRRWREAWARSGEMNRLKVIIFAWLFVVSIIVAITLIAVVVQQHDRHAAQVDTNARICTGVDRVIDYLRVFNTTTPTQLRDERIAIDKTLTNPKFAQVRVILNDLISIELAVPALANLHPFSLADVACHGGVATDDPGD